VPKSPHTRINLSGYFGTSANVSLRHFGTNAKLDLVPKCPGSEVCVKLNNVTTTVKNPPAPYYSNL